MKKIDTLVKDIRERILSDAPFDEGDVSSFSRSLARLLADRLSGTRSAPSLRLSNLGTPCDRKLWYSINQPEKAEPLSASARLKFLFGDIIEHLVLFLARAAGHTVEHEQKEVDLHGVRGHIDAVIDGELVDVKSASTLSFRKFRDHGLVEEDGFGYRTQLDGYRAALSSGAAEIERIVNPDQAHFLAVDKTLGNITLDTHDKLDVDYERMVAEKRKMLSWPKPPERGYEAEAETYYRKKTGNFKLGVGCSYCPFKKECWPKLRVFLVGEKPVFYTVMKSPRDNMKEITLEEAQED